MTKKVTDWSSWFSGLRKNLFKCIGTTGSVWLATNAAASTGLPIKGIDWEQASAMFGVHIALEIFNYMKTVEPTVIEENIETTFTSKDPQTGAVVTQTSKQTTTTPVAPIENNSP